MEFEAVIGLEVHAQLKTKTKIFCGCSTEFGAPPNTHTCPVCLGMPGVLPVLNRQVVAYTLRTAMATGCRVNPTSRFARKNYFYPDLPKGYQISQYELPIAKQGNIVIEVDGNARSIGINRIHMEEDAGKLIHDPAGGQSRVDFNRTGVPLMEIVSEPDLRSPAEAGAYLRELRDIVRYIGVCDGNMEEGSFRCDANISVRPASQKELGTRTEVKNLNSFKNVEKALAYEIERQREVILDGDEVVQETRLWDPERGQTTSMRSKEEAHDYRYFADPDLLPLTVDEDWIAAVRQKLPELPREKRQRFQEQYSLPAYDARVLTAEREVGDYFEACLKWCDNPKLVSNWVMGDLLGLLNTQHRTIQDSPVSNEQLGRLLAMVHDGRISGKIAKGVFAQMADGGQNPEKIVEEQGLAQVSDAGALEKIVDDLISANPKEVAAYKGGKTKLIGFFVGQVMRETRGKANPKVVNELLVKKLQES